MGATDSKDEFQNELRAERLRTEKMQAEKLLAEQRLKYEKLQAEKLRMENSRLAEKLRIDNERQAALDTSRALLLCQNARFGCIHAMLEGELFAHSRACSFRLLPCPLQPCSWHGNYNGLFNHVQAAHPAHLGIRFGQPTAMPVARQTWMLRRESHLFLLHSRGAPDAGGWACWTLQLLGPPEEAANWKYEISISKPQEPKKCIAISEMCVAEFEDIERVFEEARCAAVPLIVIKNFSYKNQVTLKVSTFKKFRNTTPNQ